MSYEYEQYLAHHGIKGQKWGERRFQNEDGSLTEEGIQRYQKNAYHQLKDLSKMNSRTKNQRLSEELSKGVSEDVLARHRKEYGDMMEAYDRYSKSLGTGKGISRSYERFLKKSDAYSQHLRDTSTRTLGKYSSKKLTEMKEDGNYKRKVSANEIIERAINYRLSEEYEEKRKKQ